MVRLGREGSQAGVGDGDLMGPGPGWVDLEELASGGADEASGDGPQAQPQAFGLVFGRRSRSGPAAGSRLAGLGARAVISSQIRFWARSW
jgi:hypothetical protein